MSNPFLPIEPYHNPNEGRDIINYNFSLIGGGITATTSGATFVTGGTNINVVSGLTGPADFVFGVALNSGITLNSISANSISATTLYSGSTDVSQLFLSVYNAISGSTTYTNTGATPSTVGGITAGSTFSGKTMQEMWDALLYPYQAPAFTSFSRTNLSSTYELGQVASGGAQTFTWATSNSSNVSANTISITQNFAPATSLMINGANAGTTAMTLSNSYSSGTQTTTSLYTISGKNTLGTTFTSTISRSWLPRIYYGTSSTTPLVEADIKALTSQSLASAFAGTYSFAAGNYKYFCYPTTLGTATTFKDSATNLDIAMETPYLVSVTNAYGVTLSYRVHRTTNILGSSINIIIS